MGISPGLSYVQYLLKQRGEREVETKLYVDAIDNNARAAFFPLTIFTEAIFLDYQDPCNVHVYQSQVGNYCTQGEITV